MTSFFGQRVRTVAVGAAADGGGRQLYTFRHACAFNTLMMFGTGPFISIPFCLAATIPPGPQAMVGYFVAAAGCLADSFIWGELGSRFPFSGGSYIYLRCAERCSSTQYSTRDLYSS